MEIKKQNLDSKELVVWRPEDVLLVRDLLDINYEPLSGVLKVESLQRGDGDDNSDDDNNKAKKEEAAIKKTKINTKLTAMGRPVNSKPMERWKHFGPKKGGIGDHKDEEEEEEGESEKSGMIEESELMQQQHQQDWENQISSLSKLLFLMLL